MCVSKSSKVRLFTKIPRSVKDNLECSCFRDAVELRETEMSEINGARHRVTHDCKMDIKNRTKRYLQSVTTNSCEQKTMKFHHHVLSVS